MPVSGVLISWATPAERRPIEASFSEVTSWCWSWIFSVMSSKTMIVPYGTRVLSSRGVLAMSKIRLAPVRISSEISLSRRKSAWAVGGKRARKFSGPRISWRLWPRTSCLLQAEGALQDPVPADDPAVLVEDRDAHRQALDDVLAVILEPLELQRPEPRLVVERGVLDGQRDRRRDRRQQLPVLAVQDTSCRSSGPWPGSR